MLRFEESISLEPGTIIPPNLRLVRQLAASEMSTVWVAEHRTLQTVAAVESIQPTRQDWGF